MKLLWLLIVGVVAAFTVAVNVVDAVVVNTVASIRVELPKWNVFLRRQSRPRSREERPRLHLRK